VNLRKDHYWVTKYFKERVLKNLVVSTSDTVGALKRKSVLDTKKLDKEKGSER